MKKIWLILLSTILLTACRSYSALEHIPQTKVPNKLPAMNIEIDQQSFATVVGYSHSFGGSSGNLFSSTTYASPALVDIQTVFRQDMHNFVEKYGDKKGKIVLQNV